MTIPACQNRCRGDLPIAKGSIAANVRGALLPGLLTCRERTDRARAPTLILRESVCTVSTATTVVVVIAWLRDRGEDCDVPVGSARAVEVVVTTIGSLRASVVLAGGLSSAGHSSGASHRAGSAMGALIGAALQTADFGLASTCVVWRSWSRQSRRRLSCRSTLDNPRRHARAQLIVIPRRRLPS